MARLEKDDFLQISKAIEIFDTSYSSVQRLCRKEKAGKRVKKVKNKYVIAYSLLSEHFELKDTTKERTPPAKEEERKISLSAGNGRENEEESQKLLINSLNSQIDYLKSQITSKDSQIDKLLQRQSEQNIIIQTLQTSLSNKIDSSVPLLVDAMKENKPVAPAPAPQKENDNGFTLAASIMIVLLVVMIIVYLTVK